MKEICRVPIHLLVLGVEIQSGTYQAQCGSIPIPAPKNPVAGSVLPSVPNDVMHLVPSMTAILRTSSRIR